MPFPCAPFIRDLLCNVAVARRCRCEHGEHRALHHASGGARASPAPSVIESSGQHPTRSNEDRIQSVADRYCLTKREREVLALLAEGRTAAYIAQRQFVSVNTVRTHVKRIYVKMDVTSRQQLLDVTHEDQL